MAYERLNCEECGQGFYAKTRKAKYCGNSCKQKSWRRNDEQKKQAKSMTLTFDEKAFVDAVTAVDFTLGVQIAQAIENGDVKFVKALYAVTRYDLEFDTLLMSGFAVLFPDIMRKETFIRGGGLPF